MKGESGDSGIIFEDFGHDLVSSPGMDLEGSSLEDGYFPPAAAAAHLPPNGVSLAAHLRHAARVASAAANDEEEIAAPFVEKLPLWALEWKLSGGRSVCRKPLPEEPLDEDGDGFLSGGLTALSDHLWGGEEDPRGAGPSGFPSPHSTTPAEKFALALLNAEKAVTVEGMVTVEGDACAVTVEGVLGASGERGIVEDGVALEVALAAAAGQRGGEIQWIAKSGGAAFGVAVHCRGREQEERKKSNKTTSVVVGGGEETSGGPRDRAKGGTKKKTTKKKEEMGFFLFSSPSSGEDPPDRSLDGDEWKLDLAEILICYLEKESLLGSGDSSMWGSFPTPPGGVAIAL